MVKINQIGFDLSNVNNDILVLKWTQSNFQDLCNILQNKPTSVKFLDFSFNHLYEIKKNCFHLHKKVQLLLLSNNKIATIETQAFAGLHNLLKLDLSFNELAIFSLHMFSTIHIYIFNVSQNNFKEMYVNVKILEIDMISTDDYRICCLLQESKTVCVRKPRWPQNCNLMLNTKATEVGSLILGIMIFISNGIAFTVSLSNQSRDNLKHKFNYRKHTLSSYLLSSLCFIVNDFLLGIYLIAIFSAGKYYNKNSVVNAEKWMRSLFCTFLGIHTSFTILNSLYLMALISISRLVVVKYPFNSHFKQLKLIIRYVFAGFSGNISICLGITFLYYTIEGRSEMPSSMCLFLGETLNSKTIKGFTIMISLLQFGLCISTIVIYYYIPKFHRLSDFRKKHDKQVLFHSLLVIVTHATCRLPSCIILIITVTKQNYPLFLLSWYAILLNPINSLVNPVIFWIVPFIKELWKKIKTSLH